MDYQKLSELLFPDIHETPSDIEARFPQRVLPEGARVTRLAPSPTGFMHFGTLFPAIVNERLAHQSDGVFFLRIEDTDAKREVIGAEADLISTLAYYKIHFDEGVTVDGETGAYGPYHQSHRAEIYQTYAKWLVSRGLAYPCFTTSEEYEQLMQVDKKAEIKSKDWHEDQSADRLAMLKAREITLPEVEAELAAGHPFVLRILSDGDGEKKVFCTDLIKGKLELPENDEDFVLLKSDGIPTYHFAHAVDDHLMGTTHVIRGEEWLPSLPKHLQLFRYLEFKAPKYMHIAQLMKMEGNSKKKLSKRDNGAALSDYRVKGYAPESVIEYVMTLLNSNFEEWRAANPDKPFSDFPFSIKKMSSSGALFDFDKLNDVSKNVISHMSADTVYDYLADWSKDYDPEFCEVLTADPAYAKRILSIGRGGKKPRKDLCTWSDAKPYMSLFYDRYFENVDSYPENFDKADIRKALEAFRNRYDPSVDNNAWFDGLKKIAEELGFAPEVKQYKQNPDAYKGHVGDISTFIRIALTGKTNSPDLYEIMQIIGYDRSVARLDRAIESL
ncbi:MAG: glutamate--tRNA ligase [Eubacteriales bacterium]